MDIHIWWLLAIGFAAGLMDAAVGGGGLLQIPGLFNTLPAHTSVPQIMGVNKFASANGTLMATIQFVRRIRVPWKMLLPAAVLAFVFSYVGAKLVAYIPTAWMKPAILIILLVMVVYTFCKKDLGQVVRTEKLTQKENALGLLFGALIGFYDGVFGPGTGSLLAFIYVRFYAFDFVTAIASSKIINLTTNLAALTFFIPHGYVVWQWAIPLAIANFSGGLIGARLAIKGGSSWLRYGFMLLLCIMIGRFIWELWRSHFGV
ncbi:sulfite exporter TauE/SafE family protein [Snodgrassella sp. CFCC 13594]|uniref:sulfite exporter TauE/SafE family protein n=1 Tax=Snodgrassella sp. CFCC 13594 TaxID=1775559 RepID=UPI000836ECEE|nr:sulfite exporter TauE/SafE family protein [Snodgrassella sp. CFCC 13594]